MAAHEVSRNFTTKACRFVIDSDSDVALLPNSKKGGEGILAVLAPCAMGSVAELVDGSKAYRLDGNDNWVLYTASSSGGTTPVEDIEPIDDSTIESLFD